MATIVESPKPLTMADFKGRVDPDWCPGCGDFGVLAAVQKALVELQIPNHQIVTVSGIGCSSNFPGFIETYGMHTLHGRSLPVATGVKMANHELTVLVTGGDGDGFGIGGNHFTTPSAATSISPTSSWTTRSTASRRAKHRPPAASA
jgi:2-oxoglutarate ferredoxin oxidoreductase subunit beta